MTEPDRSTAQAVDDWLRASLRRTAVPAPEPGETFDDAIRRAAGRLNQPVEPPNPEETNS